MSFGLCDAEFSYMEKVCHDYEDKLLGAVIPFVCSHFALFFPCPETRLFLPWRAKRQCRISIPWVSESDIQSHLGFQKQQMDLFPNFAFQRCWRQGYFSNSLTIFVKHMWFARELNIQQFTKLRQTLFPVCLPAINNQNSEHLKQALAKISRQYSSARRSHLQGRKHQSAVQFLCVLLAHPPSVSYKLGNLCTSIYRVSRDSEIHKQTQWRKML